MIQQRIIIRLSQFLLLCLFVLPAYNQVLYQGHITDVGTREPVSNVQVELLEIEQTCFSNNSGNFVFLNPLLASDSSNSLTGEFITQGNILVWIFNSEIDLSIYSLAGRRQFSATKLPPNGYITLNGFRNGLFLIRVTSSKGNSVFKMVSIDNQFQVSAGVITNAINKSELLSDTILFSKEGYYSSKREVTYMEKVLDINMLNRSYSDLHYFNELISKEAFDMISGTPSKTQFGEVASVKVIYDSSSDLLYYMNSKIHTNHYYFARDFLDYPGDNWTFNFTQYNSGPNRYLYPATLNYFSGSGIYSIEFFSGDGATCEETYQLFDKIVSTSFIGDKLYFYATNNSWDDCNEVPVITPNEIFEGQNYQALNIAESYGYLRKVDIHTIDNTDMNRHDIVVLNGIPIDIPVVAGIITTEFQTPLSHINVLSHNRGTPNMALRDALSNSKLDSLYGKLVYLNVESDSFTLRSATYEEAALFWSDNEPQDTLYLEIDSLTQGLIDLSVANIDEVKKLGGKAANFAELLNAFEESSMEAPVPEGYFAIPFYYYMQHLVQYGINNIINNMLSDPSFYTSSEFRNQKLKILRDTIINSPLDPDLLSMVIQRLNSIDQFTSFRFRSSTNAEDLAGFNGAGLYNSYTGRMNDSERPIDEAIKKVWASLWNYGAFEERSYFKIDHATCAMGILVHRSFPNEDANGVAITKNLYNSNNGYTINVQFGEHSIVNPEPGIMHDQLILYLFSISGEEPYTIEYISHSNILPPNQETVLSQEELFRLGDYLKIIKTYFYSRVYDCNCTYANFGLDIEFKIDSEISPRQIYIKQVRSY